MWLRLACSSFVREVKELEDEDEVEVEDEVGE